MRTLASLGVLTEDDSRRFALTPLGEALKTGAPGLGPRVDPDARRPVGSGAVVGPAAVFARDRQDRLREGARHADLRLAGAASRGGVALQRDDGRLPRRRAAGRRRGVRLLRPRRPSSTWAARPATCSTAILGAASPGPRGVLFDLPHVVRDAPALLAGARPDGPRDDRGGQLLRDGARRAATPTCSRTSSTTGARSSA